MLKILLLAVGLMTGSLFPAHAEDAAIKAVAENAVRPLYADFTRATGRLSQATTQLCAAPSEDRLQDAKTTFRQTVEAWSQVELIRFGPVTEDNRLERILFWPDRKGIALKQIQAAISEKDVDAADPAKLPGKSVAIQGLGALEFVLFGTGAETLAEPDDYRCKLGSAIAANLDTMAQAILAGWSGEADFGKIWANPGSGNPVFHTEDEAQTELLDIFIHGLELVRDVRMNGFLGASTDTDKPRLAIWWRSEATTAALRNNLGGLKRIFDNADLGRKLSSDMAWIPSSIGFEFANAETALSSIKGPVADILQEPEGRAKLDYARLVTSSLSDLFGVRLAGALGITAGFSSLDGD